jgi:uncharacterized cofD-like protein
LPAVLEGLCADADDAGESTAGGVTAVVTVTDDGGSSGRLRRELGVLPPGDVRNCLAAVARTDSPFRQLLQHRFNDGTGLEGHPIGNLLLTAMAQITGDFAEAVERLGSAMALRGRVLPTTRENVRLRAEMEDGQILEGESAIVADPRRISRLSLAPSPRPLPEVLHALVNADGIVVGPGSLYTSLLPNLLVEGVAPTMSGVNAVRIYVANLMTEPGETDGYTVDDHLRALRDHTGYDLFDYILVNRSPIDPSIAARYAEKGSFVVSVQDRLQWAGGAQVVECDMVPEMGELKIRHRPGPLAKMIRTLVLAGRPRAL